MPKKAVELPSVVWIVWAYRKEDVWVYFTSPEEVYARNIYLRGPKDNTTRVMAPVQYARLVATPRRKSGKKLR